MRRIILAAALLLTAHTALAGLLTGQGVSALDQTGAQRTTFSTNEKIGYIQIINNGSASPNSISFKFAVVAPNGNTVFRHSGNSVGGTVGNAASSVNGLLVSGFAQGPGAYTLNATANLDGIPLVQSMTFTISSPNLLLIYPPNGSLNLTDNPLSFQWYSSGAVTYRVTVGDNASLYSALFVQTTGPGATSLTYPSNPSDARQRLSTGQTYWWKVEGLDASGNVVTVSQVPYNFSVASTAQTRDLAVTALDITGAMDSSGNIPFRVTVSNQGNTIETNTPLRVTLGGLTAPDTPISVPQLSPSDVLTFNVKAPIPTDMNEGLAIACLTIFDDNVGNNCKTVSVTRPAAVSAGAITQDCGSVSGANIWLAISQILIDQGIDLTDYSFTEIDGTLSCAELTALLSQLRGGEAQASLSGPPLTGGMFATRDAEPEAEAPEDGPMAPSDLKNNEEDIKEEPKTIIKENSWSGFARPLSKEAAAVMIKDTRYWNRLWQKLSDEPVPLIDFADHMVIAVIAGGKDGAASVHIDDMHSIASAFKVRYRLIKAARPFAAKAEKTAPADAPVPYLLLAIPRTTLKVNFVREKENSDGNQ